MAALEHAEYDELPLEARVAALTALVHLALEGPSVRACLDGRLEEAQRVRKLMWEDAKARRLSSLPVLSLCMPWQTFSLHSWGLLQPKQLWRSITWPAGHKQHDSEWQDMIV